MKLAITLFRSSSDFEPVKAVRGSQFQRVDQVIQAGMYPDRTGPHEDDRWEWSGQNRSYLPGKTAVISNTVRWTMSKQPTVGIAGLMFVNVGALPILITCS